MPRRRGTGRLAVALAGLLLGSLPAMAQVAAPGATAASPAAPASLAITPENMQGVDWSGLSPAQKDMVFALAKAERCGCGMTPAECRVRDPKCPRSLPLMQQVLALASLSGAQPYEAFKKMVDEELARLQRPK